MALTTAELNNLKTARANFAAELAAVSASPKPSYRVGNQSFSWTEYYQFLLGQIQALDRQITGQEGPFEVHSTGYS